MPKNPNIKKVLVIGSGPIIIGQAAEFDYAGTQACRSLKEEGIEVVLVNSNPATIMTDKDIADEVYIEPLTVKALEQIILKEKPDSILPTLGGQAGLNLAMEIAETDFLEEHNVKLIGTTALTIKKAEDRLMFKETMEKIGEPCAASLVVNNVEDGEAFAAKIGYPVVLRPAYTLGGTGGGIAENMEQLQSFLQPYQTRLNASPVVKQFLESYLAVEPYIHPLKKDPSFLDSFLQEPVKKVQARIISISPHSKMSRYLRTHAWDNIRMGAEIFKLDDTYKNNPSLALQRLEKSFSKYTSYASRQLLLLLKGRFFAEQGEWDKARQALNQAIPMDPLSGNAGEAKKLLQSLSSNRVRLQELFYLKRRGNQEIDDEWDKLLLIETSGNVFFHFSTFDEYFN